MTAIGTSMDQSSPDLASSSLESLRAAAATGSPDAAWQVASFLDAGPRNVETEAEVLESIHDHVEF